MHEFELIYTTEMLPLATTPVDTEAIQTQPDTRSNMWVNSDLAGVAGGTVLALLVFKTIKGSNKPRSREVLEAEQTRALGYASRNTNTDIEDL